MQLDVHGLKSVPVTVQLSVCLFVYLCWLCFFFRTRHSPVRKGHNIDWIIHKVKNFHMQYTNQPSINTRHTRIHTLLYMEIIRKENKKNSTKYDEKRRNKEILRSLHLLVYGLIFSCFCFCSLCQRQFHSARNKWVLQWLKPS